MFVTSSVPIMFDIVPAAAGHAHGIVHAACYENYNYLILNVFIPVILKISRLKKMPFSDPGEGHILE